MADDSSINHDELLRGHASRVMEVNALPTPQGSTDRELARSLLEHRLAPHLVGEGLRGSVLGTAWTDVFDACVDDELDPETLADEGWVRVGSCAVRGGPGALGRWALRRDGRVLAAVDLHRNRLPERMTSLVTRCSLQGVVRLRDVMEARELVRHGGDVSASSTVLQKAAEIETGLSERVLVRWATGQVVEAPATLGPPDRASRRRRVVVALSGVDGAGKSSLSDALADDLRRAGVPVSRVWLRPGMALGWLAVVADRGRAVLRQGTAPGIRAVAADPSARIRSRRGIVGWVWSLLVVVSFLLRSRRQERRNRGVVLYDRHLLDALSTLDYAYGGVDKRLQQWLLRRALPRADVAIYLSVPAEVALARKPGDVVGEKAVNHQLTSYRRHLASAPGVVVLDGTRERAHLAADVFDRVAEHVTRRM